MKNRFISLSEARLMSFKAVSSSKSIPVLKQINPAVRQRVIILSSEQLNQAGYK
jgi:hypothetical protein